MKRGIKEIWGIKGCDSTPLDILKYLKKNNYLNFSDMEKYLEKLYKYGSLNKMQKERLHEFYDMFADELFIRKHVNYTERITTEGSEICFSAEKPFSRCKV